MRPISGERQRMCRADGKCPMAIVAIAVEESEAG